MEDCSISGVQEFSRWERTATAACVCFIVLLLRLLNPDRTYQECAYALNASWYFGSTSLSSMLFGTSYEPGGEAGPC